MNQQMIIFISEILLLTAVCVGLIVVISAGMYDIRTISRRRRVSEIMKKLRKPRQSPVTVLVFAKNNSATILDCLRSLGRSQYRKFDIVVIDDASTDDTRKLVREYCRQHPRISCRLYARRKIGAKHQALKRGYSLSERGDAVLVINGDSVVTPALLKLGVAQLSINPKSQAVQCNEYSEVVRIATMVGYFVRLSRHMIAKGKSLFRRHQVMVGQPSVMYRRSVFERHAGVKVVSVFAGNMVISVTDGQERVTQLERIHRPKAIFWIAAIVVFFGMTYSIYAAASLQSSDLLLLSWLALTFWCLGSVWSDEVVSVSDKILLSFCAPVVYFLVYAELFARGLAEMVFAGVHVVRKFYNMILQTEVGVAIK